MMWLYVLVLSLGTSLNGINKTVFVPNFIRMPTPRAGHTTSLENLCSHMASVSPMMRCQYSWVWKFLGVMATLSRW